MRLITFALVILLCTAMTPPKKKIIFFGDSITQAGVDPGGYITLLRELDAKQGGADRFDYIGAGIGGNKVYDLYLRLDDDVLSQSPDVVVIWVGVNDVWHKRSFGTGTDPGKFEKFYHALIRRIQARGARVVLVTPAVVGERTDYSNELDGDLNAYSNIIRRLAQQYNAPLVDLRQVFHDYNVRHNPDNKDQGILTYDRVHLNAAGNQLVAEQMWGVLQKM